MRTEHLPPQSKKPDIRDEQLGLKRAAQPIGAPGGPKKEGGDYKKKELKGVDAQIPLVQTE